MTMPVVRSTSRFPVILLLLLPSLSSAQNQSQRQAIASALRNNAFPEALVLLQPALAQSPSDTELLAMQGAAYAGEHRDAEALSSYNKALKLSPDYLPALHGAIQVYYDAANPAAIPLLQRALRLRPTDQTSHGMLAVLEYQQGNCKAAAAEFEEAGDLFNSQPGALHAYAACLVKTKQFDRATVVLQRALALDPDNQQERQVLASVELMAHKPQDAVATIEPLLTSTSANGDTLELAANAYEDAGSTENAVNTLRKAILLDPKDVHLYVDFAQLCFAHQSFQAGIDVVSDGIGQQPKAAQLYFARGVLYVQLAKYSEAEDDFEKAYQLDPGESLTAAAQGLLAVQQNDLDRALASVKQRLAQKPNDPVLLYLQADVLTQKGAEPGTADFQVAMRSAESAVALRPSLGPARSVLAKLYMQAGKDRQAIEQCRKALEIDPKDQTSLYRLIQLLRKSGNNADLSGLLKRLAQLRQETAKNESQRYRFKIIEDQTKP